MPGEFPVTLSSTDKLTWLEVRGRTPRRRRGAARTHDRSSDRVHYTFTGNLTLHTPADELTGAVAWDAGHCSMLLNFLDGVASSTDGWGDVKRHSTQDSDLDLSLSYKGRDSVHVRAVLLDWWDPDSPQGGQYSARELTAEFEASLSDLELFALRLHRLLHDEPR